MSEGVATTSGPASVFGRFVTGVLDRPVIDTTGLLSLFMLMLSGPDPSYSEIPISLLAIAGILHAPWRAKPGFWLTLAGFVFLYDVLEWNEADNHKWLMGWWCVALSMVHRVPEANQREVLASNARWILALVFTFATLWKMISFDYLDHGFFEAKLLTDSRFAAISEMVGGLDKSDLRENRRAFKLAAASLSDSTDRIQLVSNDRIGWIAAFITWWLVIVEGGLAAVLLWPGNSNRTRVVRSLVVLLFAGTTYSFVPVRGFGWLVIAMGYAHTPDEHRRIRGAYFALIVAMYLFSIRLPGNPLDWPSRLFGETIPFP